MYKMTAAVCVAVCFLLAGNAGWSATTLESGKGCSPTNIEYCPKKGGNSLMGGKFTTYNVRCSNGAQRTITRWETGERWCVEKDQSCTNSQMQAAKLACVK